MVLVFRLDTCVLRGDGLEMTLFQNSNIKMVKTTNFTDSFRIFSNNADTSLFRILTLRWINELLH
jgi:hypothetical protein